ncbi:tetratricopeptide repeat protein [Aliiroseovarius sp. 2305UL8-7]|uniref:tetratricopeptide repeat protein n=1 Tax=Aliiroseovarius conchicola TaxID=3121637 RepID=UPI003526DDB2
MLRAFLIVGLILGLSEGLPGRVLAQSTTAPTVPEGGNYLSSPHSDELDNLFTLLANADETNWKALEEEIWDLWSRSGSDTFDLLLARGRDAMDEGDLDAAIEHLTALTDHAPEFAEGWNARATAFYLSGQLGLSLDDIARTLTLEPRHFGALSGLGLILEQLGDPDRALQAFQYSLAIHPQSPRVKEAVKRLETASGQDI